MAANWLAHRMMPLKKQVHPRWEFSGFNDPTQEAFHNLRPSKMDELLQEMFQNICSWPTPKKVPYYHIGVGQDLVRQFSLFIVIFMLLIYLFHAQIQVLDSFFSTIPGFKTDSDSKSAQARTADSADDNLVSHDSEPSRTRTGKRKATDTPPPQKNPRKEVWYRSSKINIDEPTSNPSSAPTPPESIEGRYYFCRSNR
jgi:hypothetical protein